MTRKSCQYCRYRRPVTPMRPQETVCHYLLDTGEPRGCPAARCTRWQPTPGWQALLTTIRREN